jgi:hypothetical protein
MDKFLNALLAHDFGVRDRFGHHRQVILGMMNSPFEDGMAAGARRFDGQAQSLIDEITSDLEKLAGRDLMYTFKLYQLCPSNIIRYGKKVDVEVKTSPSTEVLSIYNHDQ